MIISALNFFFIFIMPQDHKSRWGFAIGIGTMLGPCCRPRWRRWTWSGCRCGKTGTWSVQKWATWQGCRGRWRGRRDRPATLYLVSFHSRGSSELCRRGRPSGTNQTTVTKQRMAECDIYTHTVSHMYVKYLKFNICVCLCACASVRMCSCLSVSACVCLGTVKGASVQ